MIKCHFAKKIRLQCKSVKSHLFHEDDDVLRTAALIAQTISVSFASAVRQWNEWIKNLCNTELNERRHRQTVAVWNEQAVAMATTIIIITKRRHRQQQITTIKMKTTTKEKGKIKEEVERNTLNGFFSLSPCLCSPCGCFDSFGQLLVMMQR